MAEKKVPDMQGPGGAEQTGTQMGWVYYDPISGTYHFYTSDPGSPGSGGGGGLPVNNGGTAAGPGAGTTPVADPWATTPGVSTGAVPNTAGGWNNIMGLSGLFGGGGAGGPWWQNQGLWNLASGLISQYFGNKAAKDARKLSPQEQQMFDLIIRGTKSQSDFGNLLMGLAKDPLISSQHFLTAAANGDQDAIMKLAGPQMRNISEGAKRSLQTMSQLMPRSGASSEFLSNLPFQTAAQINDVAGNTQRDAQSQLLGFGTNLANLGGNFVGGASQGGQNVLDYSRQRNNDAFQIGAQTGSSIYDMLKSVIGGTKQNNTGAQDYWGLYSNQRG